MMNKNILVSSCLLGVNCKYNGGNNLNKELVEFLKKYNVISACPEVLGGLPTPRIPSEICGGKVINEEGSDVTDNFKLGAKKTLEIAKENDCTHAIFKKNSPSCGFNGVYDGTFTSRIIKKNGITSDLLYQNGIVILNENNYKEGNF